MPWTDISRVTNAITLLVRQVIEGRDALTTPIEVTAAPYEEVAGVGPNVIHFHLFHMLEDPHQRNMPPVRAGTPPTQFMRLGLVLNYVVTARNTIAVEVADRTLTEQRLLGYTARALHDFPVIDDTTQIGANTPILQHPLVAADGDDNVIQLTLRPVPIDESISFWSTQQLVTPRLALFYEARVVLLSTPESNEIPGIVLTVGNYISTGGGPGLLALRSRIGFVPAANPAGPATPPGVFTVLSSNPARVGLFPVGLALPPGVVQHNQELSMEGQNLTGARVLIELRGPVVIGANPVQTVRFRIDATNPAANPDWEFSLGANLVRVALRQTVQDDQGRTIELMPGIFRARVVVAQQPLGDSIGRLRPQSSNDLLFALIPQVVQVTDSGGPLHARAYSIHLYGSYLRDDLEVELVVGGSVSNRVSGAPLAGEFTFTAGSSQLDFAVNATGMTGPLPVRLMIEGAESTPAWAVL